MAQINIWLYAEIIDGDNPPIKIGSRVDPLTKTIVSSLGLHIMKFPGLIAKEEIYNSASSPLAYLDGFFVKASEAGVIAFDGLGIEDNSSFPIPADVWIWFPFGETTNYVDTGADDRVAQALQDITSIWFKPTTTPADVQIIGYTDV